MTTESSSPPVSDNTVSESHDFIRDIIRQDRQNGKHDGRVVTRFPPEPNGYLHIGHAKSICLNFTVASDFAGRCHLRFDDTNPATEDVEYAEAIQRDVQWLGFDWGEHLYFASDYFETFYDYAVHLIRNGLAYVDSLNEAEIREYRGTISEAGKPSPYRERSVEENLDLLARMRNGEFEDGAHVLRAKIDMAAKNMLMRDPLLYRIRCAEHYRTGDAWNIYPMYDFAHCLEDAIEGVTHSLCTLEFENNRELYDWVLDHTPAPHRPQQIEFARLNLSYTITSKRKLLQLVTEGFVAGWDDPRMPTLSGLRRRGYTPESIRNFCERVGVARTHNIIDVALLEYSIRDDLNAQAPRVLSVLRPLKVVIENYPEDGEEHLEAPYFPHDVPKEGSRQLPFSREILIERDDFEEDPPEGFFRLAPGREVRLRYAYIIRCNEVIKDEDGVIQELRCTYDPETRGGNTQDGRKVQGTLHWVSARHALPLEVRIYDRLFTVEQPGSGDHDYLEDLNRNSLEVLTESRIEPSVEGAQAGDHFQLERQGYFVVDPDTSEAGLVLNRTVTLRDTWAKLTGQGKAEERKRAAAAKAAAKVAAKELQRQQSDDGSIERPLTEAQEVSFRRFEQELDVPAVEARLLASDDEVAAFFERALVPGATPKAVANWVVNEVLREAKQRSLDALPIHGPEIGELVKLIENGTISGKIAKKVFAELIVDGGQPSEIVERLGLQQMTDEGAIRQLIADVLTQNASQVEAYRQGKTALMGFFVGQVMKASRGKANPQQVNALLSQMLKEA